MHSEFGGLSPRLYADNFKYDENGEKFSKRVENAVEKGKIDHKKQFLLFPKSFQKTCTADM
jgi:hypothetical protein